MCRVYRVFVDIKEFEEETHELKPVKPEIMTGMKPSNLKSVENLKRTERKERVQTSMKAHQRRRGHMTRQGLLLKAPWQPDILPVF